MPGVIPSVECSGCSAVIDCGVLDQRLLYNFQSEVFPFVLSCPAGFTCSGGAEMRVICCGQEFQVAFPPGVTDDDRLILTRSLLENCARALDFCGQLPKSNPPPGAGGGSGTPGPAVPRVGSLFFNQPQTCTAICPDGNLFSYTLPAGIMLGFSQAAADAAAFNYACAQAKAKRICLGQITTTCCIGATYSSRITAIGASLAVPPATNFWSVESGTVPPGITITLGNVAGAFITLSGAPTTAGTFTFTVKVVTPTGESMSKAFTITVRGLTDTSPLPNATLNTTYAFLLGAGGLMAPLFFFVSSGSLPPGLSLDGATGEITGTPTSSGTFPFTISVKDSS